MGTPKTLPSHPPPRSRPSHFRPPPHRSLCSRLLLLVSGLLLLLPSAALFLSLFTPMPSADIIFQHRHEAKALWHRQMRDRHAAPDLSTLSTADFSVLTNQLLEPGSLIRQLSNEVALARAYSVVAADNGNPILSNQIDRQVQALQALMSSAAVRKSPITWAEAVPSLRQMASLLLQAKELHYDPALALVRLRGQVAAAEEKAAGQQTQAALYSQVASESIPKPLQCLTVSLTLLSQQLQPDAQSRIDTWQQSPALSDSSRLHFCIFSDNVVAVAVAVNSTVVNSPASSRLVFHIVTDHVSFRAIQAWFALNPPGDAVVEVRDVDSLTWFNSSYAPALRQMQTKDFRQFYLQSLQGASDPVKFHNPKYMSPLNHIRFYLPQLYPNLRRILFLDDDVVVQRDLSPLFSMDIKGNVIGAVETCRESFHRFHRYLNFSDPRLRDHFDPEGCGWAFGMNLIDLDAWRKANITEVYHFWQEQNANHSLWKLGTLPPGLLAFYGHVQPIDKDWHVLGLGYNRNVDLKLVQSGAVIHYNGNQKPWLKLGFSHYRSFWTRYLHTSSSLLQMCQIV